MDAIEKRLAKLEAAAANSNHRPRPVRRFIIQGPHGLAPVAAVAYLQEQGHEINPDDFNIVRHVVGAADGKPVDLPFVDLTTRPA